MCVCVCVCNKCMCPHVSLFWLVEEIKHVEIIMSCLL